MLRGDNPCHCYVSCDDYQPVESLWWPHFLLLLASARDSLPPSLASVRVVSCCIFLPLSPVAIVAAYFGLAYKLWLIGRDWIVTAALSGCKLNAGLSVIHQPPPLPLHPSPLRRDICFQTIALRYGAQNPAQSFRSSRRHCQHNPRVRGWWGWRDVQIPRGKKADEKLLIRISLFIINYSHRMRMWTGCRTQDTLPPELSATPHTKKLNIPEFNCCVMQLSRHSDIKYKAERKRCKRKHVKYFFESGEGGGEWKSTWTVRKAGRGKRKSENEIIVFFS